MIMLENRLLNLKRERQNPFWGRTREGLSAVISVKLAEPQFEGQTKSKLGNPEIRNQTDSVVAQAVQLFWKITPLMHER
ncbi:MAG: hypothetical protein CM1200mP38_2010 [Dehalococcoidia bacterium]|nr:MAG: hypothetical protein CM1200mP38_2010 [Dehalococcoidia bacterium]